MRKIQKTISLEEFTSRVPGIVPAYARDGNFYGFSEDDITMRDGMYMSNYGMIPANVSFPGYTITDNGATISGSAWNNGATVSYSRVCGWYHFFENYYHLLNDYGSCGNVYTSATQYYESESLDNERSASDANLYLGNDKDTYVALDKRFSELGGVVASMTAKERYEGYDDILDDNGLDNPIVVSYDTGVYDYICKNFIPTYPILKEYQDYWGARKLFYADAVKWHLWFSERYEPYRTYSANTQCANSDNCCDCAEYLNRGGNDTYLDLSDWIDDMSGKAEELFEAYSGDTYIPSMKMSLDGRVSLEDLGEMSIFSEEWEPGVNYFSEDGGVVVTNDGEPYILKEGEIGYKYDDRYYENVWGNDPAHVWNGSAYTMDDTVEWESYSDKYISEHLSDYESAYDYYIRDLDGNIRLVHSDAEARQIMTTMYDYISGQCFNIEGVSYEISEKDIVTFENTSNVYLDGKTFLVYYEKYTNTPYIVVNGQKKYATQGKIAGNDIYSGKVIQYNGTVIVVGDSQNLTVKNSDYGYVYPLIDKIADIEGAEYLVKNSRLIEYSGFADTETEGVRIQLYKDITDEVGASLGIGTMSIGEIGITAVHSYNLVNTSVISGNTTSKITSFLPDVKYSDDFGNVLDGIYEYESLDVNSGSTASDIENSATTPIYAQPAEGTVLGLYYQPGLTSLLSKSPYYSDELKLYDGNIIRSMTFYYRDTNGERITETEVSALPFSADSALSQCNALAEDFVSASYSGSGEARQTEENISCDIVYNMGGTLIYSSGLTLAHDAGLDYSEGVEYRETVHFVKKQEVYMISTGEAIPVWAYVLKREENDVLLDDYGKSSVVPTAKFFLKKATFSGSGKNGADMEKYNGTKAYPTFRMEYQNGNKALESVESSIYIDRGSHNAIDRHLKIGEISSMESLENYTNGFFSII